MHYEFIRKEGLMQIKNYRKCAHYLRDFDETDCVLYFCAASKYDDLLNGTIVIERFKTVLCGGKKECCVRPYCFVQKRKRASHRK